jgi:hypothetical protein
MDWFAIIALIMITWFLLGVSLCITDEKENKRWRWDSIKIREMMGQY